MLKKMFMAVLAAALMAAALGGAVLAEEAQPEGARRGITFHGQITALGESDFTLETQRGTVTILVNEDTLYRAKDGVEITFADLEVERWVTGRAFRNEADELVAGGVVLLPEDFVPGVGYAGEVTAVDAANSAFSLHTFNEEDLTFKVDANTVYRGEVSGLDDLEVGMKVGVYAHELDDGSLLARAVGAKPPRPERQRNAGKVTAVDVGASTFSIQTRAGDGLTFLVGENTQFRSRSGEVESLSDLKEDMAVVVVSVAQDDGSLMALAVMAGENAPGGLRAGGQVTEVTNSSLTIQTRSGESLTFQITGQTRFVSRDGEVESLDDIEAGMVVIVAYEEVGGGNLKANVVAVPQQPEE